MRLKAFAILAVMLITMASSTLATGTFGQQQSGASREKADRISGDWDVTFEVEGNSVPATFSFKVDGNKIIGTVDSAHTGHGTFKDGSWIDNKLSFTVDFSSHESIAVTGSFRDGKLSGEFKTEGMTGTWEAKKK